MSKSIRESGEFAFDSSLNDESWRKDSFVGTPLYVSPEMLTDCQSLPASDLWSLGVLIYKMHVG